MTTYTRRLALLVSYALIPVTAIYAGAPLQSESLAEIKSRMVTVLGPDAVFEDYLEQVADGRQTVAWGDPFVRFQPLPQTIAHLSIPANFAAASQRYKFDQEGTITNTLFKAVVEKERAVMNNNYVFYHALTNAWRVPQDLYKALYKKINNKEVPESFRFLRFSDPSNTEGVGDFAYGTIKREGLINDNLSKNSARLLSVNLALFGNVNFDGEATIEYFLKPKSHAKVKPEVFKAILDNFGIKNSESYIKRLEALHDTYLLTQGSRGNPGPQTLLQIVVPKAFVNAIGYPAFVRGIPYNEDFVTLVDNLTRKTFSRTPLYEDSARVYDLIQKVLVRYPESRLAKKLEASSTDSLKDLLERYVFIPYEVPYLNNRQARLYFTPEGLLNPKSGIQMYEYDFIPQDKKEAYNRELAQLVNEMTS